MQKTYATDLPEVILQKVLIKSIVETGVSIRKAAYEGVSKWTLMYKRAIEASIEDEYWLNIFQLGVEEAPHSSSLSVGLEETYISNENDDILGPDLQGNIST